jgi:hypothetical protein
MSSASRLHEDRQQTNASHKNDGNADKPTLNVTSGHGQTTSRTSGGRAVFPITTAKLKYGGWNLLCVFGQSIVSWTVISEGLRFLIPVLGQRLSKLPIPGFSLLSRYQATYRWDLANTMAVFLFLAMWSLWGMILKTYLGSDEHFQRQGWDPHRYRRLVMVLGKLILSCDLILFYIAMVQMGWSGSVFSFPALVASAAYLAVIIFVKLKSITLEKQAFGP